MVDKAGRRGGSPPEVEIVVPKFQNRVARQARRIQADTGLRYTVALRLYAPDEEWLGLAAELCAAGLDDAAEVLNRSTLVLAESGMWIEAFAKIENEFFDTDREKVRELNAVCGEAARAMMRREGFQTAGYEPSAEAYHSAFIALSHAGTVPDGQRLARAAIGVFDADPLDCSDVIRAGGRFPFTYDSAARLTGPDVPTAVAAREAARAMATASRVPFGGDDEWFEAAGHMVSAVWHGGLAAGLPPLHGRRGFQHFFRSDMEGSLPA